MQEQWLPIIGYEGFYEVSNLGRVKSIARWKPQNNGGKCWVEDRILNNSVNNRGYVRLCLHRDSKGKSYKLSRLVAQAFVPNPNNLPYVNHIDGVKTNDIYTNLEWCSQSDNVKHAYTCGLRQSAIGKVRLTILSFEKAEEIRALYKSGDKNQREIAELYGVSTATINGIINYKIWQKA